MHPEWFWNVLYLFLVTSIILLLRDMDTFGRPTEHSINPLVSTVVYNPLTPRSSSILYFRLSWKELKGNSYEFYNRVILRVLWCRAQSMTNLFPRFVPFWVFSRRYTVHDWLKIKVKQTCESLSFLSVAKSRRMSLNDDYSSCYRDYTYGKSQRSGRNWRLGNLPELPNHYSDRRFLSFLFYTKEICSMHAMQF